MRKISCSDCGLKFKNGSSHFYGVFLKDEESEQFFCDECLGEYYNLDENGDWVDKNE